MSTNSIPQSSTAPRRYGRHAWPEIFFERIFAANARGDYIGRHRAHEADQPVDYWPVIL